MLQNDTRVQEQVWQVSKSNPLEIIQTTYKPILLRTESILENA